MVFDRAVEHMDGFEDVILCWLQESPHVVAYERDEQAFKSWRFSPPIRPFVNPIYCEAVFRERYPIEPSWALLLNDALRSFRSSLDHLAYSLASAYTNPLLVKAAEQSEFPIFSDRPPTPGELQKKIGAIDPRAQAIIKGLQPHWENPPWQNALCVLQELERRSKHRLLPLLRANPGGVMLELGPHLNIGNNLSMNRGGPMEDGTPMMQVIIEPVDPQREVNVNFIPGPFDVAIGGEFPVASAREALQSIRRKITDDVFAPLEPFL